MYLQGFVINGGDTGRQTKRTVGKISENLKKKQLQNK